MCCNSVLDVCSGFSLNRRHVLEAIFSCGPTQRFSTIVNLLMGLHLTFPLQGRTNLSPDKVPWSAFRTLLSQCIYGGRIDNDFDQRLLNSFVHRLFTARSFESDFPLMTNVDGMEGKCIKMPDGIRWVWGGVSVCVCVHVCVGGVCGYRCVVFVHGCVYGWVCECAHVCMLHKETYLPDVAIHL